MYSRVQFTGDGTTVRFPVVFTLGILRESHVTCRVGDEIDASGSPLYRNIIWDDNDPGWARISGAAPSVGTPIVFTRTVPTDSLMYDFQRHSILSNVALNESHKQLMMAVHQMMDAFNLAVEDRDRDLAAIRADFLDFTTRIINDYTALVDTVDQRFAEALSNIQVELANAIAEAKIIAQEEASEAVRDKFSTLSVAVIIIPDTEDMGAEYDTITNTLTLRLHETSLPAMSATVRGGARLGAGFTITDTDVLSVDWRTSGVTIYVRTDGNDANDGFANTAARAVAGWDGVWRVISGLNMKNANVTISFQAGEWPGVVVRSSVLNSIGNSGLYITGIAGSTVFNSSVYFQDCVGDIRNVSVKGTIVAAYNGDVYLSGCTSLGGGSLPTAVQADSGGMIRIGTGGHTFSGTLNSGLFTHSGGTIRVDSGVPITFTDCSFTGNFLVAGSSGGPGNIHIYNPIYSGSFTGNRYAIGYGGSITGVTKAQLDALPGTGEGTTSGFGLSQSGQFISRGGTANSGYLLADGTDILKDSTANIAALTQTVTGKLDTSRFDVSQQIMHVQDQKATGTAGGNITAGAWRTRDLNVVVKNTISGASLANNQITLPPGEYYIVAESASYSSGTSRAAIYNVTSANRVLTGINQHIIGAYQVGGILPVSGYITLSGTSKIELHNRISSGGFTTVNGVAAAFTGELEIYSDIFIQRIS